MSKKHPKTTTSKSKPKAKPVPVKSGTYYGDLPPRRAGMVRMNTPCY